jgi:hypothetical protein
MKSKFSLLLVISILGTSCNMSPKVATDPKADEEAIRAVFNAEQIAWNNGNMEGYMEGYWKSDSLQFMSERGINHGWQETLDGYKKRYADIAAMGTLSYELLKVTRLAPNIYVVMGKYHLIRSIGNLDGVFTAILKKIDGKWVTVYDHSA